MIIQLGQKKKKLLVIGFKHWKLEGKLNTDDEWFLMDERTLTELPEIGEELTFDIFNNDNKPFICSQIRFTIIDSPVYEPTENDKWDNILRICRS